MDDSKMPRIRRKEDLPDVMTMPLVAKTLGCMNTPPETVPLDRTNGAARPLKWCMVTADMVH